MVGQTPVLLLTIGIGGAVGAWARFRVAGAIYARTAGTFPWGTLAVNALGSLLLGALLPLLHAHAPGSLLHAFITVGCIGGFTTFSTFAYEAAVLALAGARRTAAAYAAASVVVCMLGLLIGLALGTAIV